MTARLTDEMRRQVAAHPGQAVPVLDEQAHKTYYLIDEASLQRLQGLGRDEDGAIRERLRNLIKEGIQSEHVSAEEAEARIRKAIQGYADRVV